ncbi:MAG: phospholipase D family protein [Flavobacteriaceae bacterium]|nr:phospholipase D family protein [Flavobacteriaceae bacterium]
MKIQQQQMTGKKLLNDIRSARKSIRIVSPYLSPLLISELINFRKRNLEVELITTDNIEDFYGNYVKNILQLIIQNRETNIEAVEKREKWSGISKILTYINIGLYKNKIKNKRIYFYWYSQLFPFKVYMSPNTTDMSDTFIHGKICLIDDQIAYLGSLNFTASGTKHNYETRIRTTDPKAIKEIKEEFNQLLNHSNLPERDIQYWGKQLYKEPIN